MGTRWVDIPTHTGVTDCDKVQAGTRVAAALQQILTWRCQLVRDARAHVAPETASTVVEFESSGAVGLSDPFRFTGRFPDFTTAVKRRARWDTVNPLWDRKKRRERFTLISSSRSCTALSALRPGGILISGVITARARLFLTAMLSLGGGSSAGWHELSRKATHRLQIGRTMTSVFAHASRALWERPWCCCCGGDLQIGVLEGRA